MADTPAPYLKPVCMALRWLCMIVAVLTVITTVAVSVAIPFAKGDAAYQMRIGEGERPTIERAASDRPVLSGSHDFSFTVDGKQVPMTPSLIAVLVVTAAPALAGLVWGLWNGAGLFQRLGRGEYFVRGTVRALRNLAIGLLIYKGAPLLALPFMALASAPYRTERSLNLSLNLNILQMDGLLTIIFLGMIVVFAQVMTRATEIAEDNAQIV